MDFKSTAIKLVERYLGRKPQAEEGVSEAAIRRREKELGVKLPKSFRAYFQATGNLPQLNRAHNLLYDLPGLLVEDGYLIFMEENQVVVHWGFRLIDLPHADPDVWQRTNSRPPAWHSEELPFSKWIVKMFDWQFGFDDESHGEA